MKLENQFESYIHSLIGDIQREIENVKSKSSPKTSSPKIDKQNSPISKFIEEAIYDELDDVFIPSASIEEHSIYNDGTIHCLNTNTKKFSGEKYQDVDDWLFHMNVSLRNARIPEHDRVDHAILFLNGKAFTYIRFVREYYEQNSKQFNWNEFCNSLRKRFKSSSNESIIRKKLSTLRQNTDSYDTYLNQYLSLCNQATYKEISEKDRFEYFLSGLRTDLREDIVNKQITSLYEAILAAQESDEKHQSKINAVKSYEKHKIVKNKTNIMSLPAFNHAFIQQYYGYPKNRHMNMSMRKTPNVSKQRGYAC